MILLGGCGGSLLSSRASNPVISDGLLPGFPPDYYNVVSTTAGRRSIFIGYKDPAGNPLPRPAVCAEPPPDAIDAIANAFTVSASGKGTQAELANSVAVSSALGLYRSQGLQILRDQTFQLCIRAMATNMSPQDWSNQQAKIIDAALRVIQAEMPAITVAASRWTNVAVTPPDPFGKPPAANPAGGNQSAANAAGGNQSAANATGGNQSAANPAGGNQSAANARGTAPPSGNPKSGPGSKQQNTAPSPTGYQGTFTFDPLQSQPK
jgi:hypothetical protein